jgi:hypothetical protein
MDAADLPPTPRVIRVADRGGTVFDVLGPAGATGRDVLVRAAGDHRVVQSGRSLGATAAAQSVLGPWTVCCLGTRHPFADGRPAAPAPTHRRAEPRVAPTVATVGVREETPLERTAPLAWLRLTPWPGEARTSADTVGRSETSRGRLARSQDVLTREGLREDLLRETFDRWDQARASPGWPPGACGG